MNEKDLQARIAWHIMHKQKHEMLTFNIAWILPFECDVASIDTKGWLHEYEIKVTAADFRKDFDKSFSGFDRNGQVIEYNKHELLQDGLAVNKIPNRFSFVCPDGLIDPKDVPDYAGLYFVNESGVVKKIRAGKIIHKFVDPGHAKAVARNVSLKYASLHRKLSLEKQNVQFIS